jgi:hypothetical protein
MTTAIVSVERKIPQYIQFFLAANLARGLRTKLKLKSHYMLLLSLLMWACSAAAQESYDTHFRAAERAKAKSDFAAMEAALEKALQLGPGDEYAWRSLAWAQARQGKWRPSLTNAWENLKRHGERGWPLRQLFDSAMVAGDIDLARNTLGRASNLPLAWSDNLNFDSDWRQIEGVTAPRTYRVTFVIQDKSSNGPLRYLIPALKAPRQTAQLKVEGAQSWNTFQEGRDWLLAVVPRLDKPFRITLNATLQMIWLGPSRLAKVPPGSGLPAVQLYLGAMRNGSWLDPSEPECLALARTLKGRTSAETVQNILDWLKKNMIHEPPYGPDTVSAILRDRHGLCHHHVNVMVGLCRAAGVPAVIAHGIVLPDDKGEVKIGHGWLEVYLNGIGWVPVEPLNPDSLRCFGGATYLFLHSTGHTPEQNHFSPRYRSLQGYTGQAERLHL